MYTLVCIKIHRDKPRMFKTEEVWSLEVNTSFRRPITPLSASSKCSTHTDARGLQVSATSPARRAVVGVPYAAWHSLACISELGRAPRIAVAEPIQLYIRVLPPGLLMPCPLGTGEEVVKGSLID